MCMQIQLPFVSISKTTKPLFIFRRTASKAFMQHKTLLLMERKNNNQYMYVFRKQTFTSVINPDWDFQKMGIGGLDQEFNAIFRRAFASRVFPPEIVDQLGA